MIGIAMIERCLAWSGLIMLRTWSVAMTEHVFGLPNKIGVDHNEIE